MSEDIERILTELGLSAREEKLYFYLAKSGPQMAVEISKSLKMHKVEVYRFLKSLENRGLLESTLERPMRFTATPLEQILDSLIAERKKTTNELEEKKDDILNQWKAMKADKLSIMPEKFAVLSGRGNIYSKVLNLVNQTQREILVVTSDVGLLLADQSGFLSRGIAKAVARNRAGVVDIFARVLTQVTEENLDEVKSFSQNIQQHHLRVEIRHLTLSRIYPPRLAIRDDEEVVIFLSPKNLSLFSRTCAREETGLWTNSKAVVCAVEALFEELWHDSKSLSDRIEELEKQPIDP